MSTLVYALALFGCSDDATICERINAEMPRFESRVACDVAATNAVVSDEAMRSDHPTVIAECMPEGQLLAMGTGMVDLTQANKRQSTSGRNYAR